MTTRAWHAVEALADDLTRWLPTQRWYAAKGTPLTSVRVDRATVLFDGDPALVLAMIETTDGELYQVPIGLRAELTDHLRGAAIGPLGDLIAYDAAQDPELMDRMLSALAAGSDLGGVSFRVEPGVELVTDLRARPVSVEQSNTSVIFGYHYILKLFRRPTPGINRDVELHRALRTAGSPHIAEPVAVIAEPATDTVLGFMQRYVNDAAEGWATATASVRDLFAEADLHAEEVGGDFAGESGRLGAAVAQVHLDLARSTGTGFAGPDLIAAEADLMHSRLDRVLAEVPDLAVHEPVLREAFDAIRGLTGPIAVQQIHGDLHLGQVLRCATGWVLIDFEGEPAAPPEERLAARSPLRDVAGMLRSFDYAALHLLAGTEPEQQAKTRAAEWAARNRDSFCAGYATVAQDPAASPVLLRAFELDKAVYEVGYEHRNRPDWLPIPLAAIRAARLSGPASGG